MDCPLPDSIKAEFRPDFVPKRRCTHAVFDFDGTLSWLRHGWPEIMADVFRPHFPKTRKSEEEIAQLLLSDILSLNGKPSIHQMNRFQERVRERGGTCPDPKELLDEYQRRLDHAIAERSKSIRKKTVPRDHFVIHAARPLLEWLKEQGIALIILSGTAEHRVREEAQLLDLDHYFDGHIFGSTGPDFSKRQIIERLLQHETLPGNQLLSFGDGPVEIAETRRVGGTAIGVASDEKINGSRKPDPIKRRELLSAGADVLIPDFRDAIPLMNWLFYSPEKSLRPE